jgi:NADH-quinone oxidoreductase subunit I
MFKESYQGIYSLLVGLGITFRQLFVKSFTVQYPEQRVQWPVRTRGRLVLPRDAQTKTNRCTACLMCERICPNGTIELQVITPEGGGKKQLKDYLYHL